MDGYDVFISAKSEDLAYSRQVYEYLTARGIKAFLSNLSLRQVGDSDYQEVIEAALERAKHLVVVGSSRENMISSWVRAEWRMFVGEKRAGRKSGNVVTVLAGSVDQADLPLALRNFQTVRLDKDGLETLLSLVRPLAPLAGHDLRKSPPATVPRRYRFVDQTMARAVVAEVDPHARVGDLIPAILDPLKLPRLDNRGVPVHYLLFHEGRALHNLETLASAGVGENEHITVVALACDLGGGPPESSEAPARGTSVGEQRGDFASGEMPVPARAPAWNRWFRFPFLRRTQHRPSHRDHTTTGLPVREVPTECLDRVTFTVTSPPMVQAGMSFVLDVWAHLKDQRAEVVRRAREAYSEGRIQARSKGPALVARGTVLSVRLRLEDLIVEEAEDAILWAGEIGNATFLVTVPNDAAEGSKAGLATVYANGLQIARMHFEIRVGPSLREVRNFRTREERHRKAFASYASADRDSVLARIQGIQKAAPNLDVFVDVVSLRSGQYWENELWSIIPANDVFYLFWSKNAADSEWVDKEWRCALSTRGLDFIDPVPLVSPDEAPPPTELSSKHFNDWVLAYMRGAGGPRSQ